MTSRRLYTVLVVWCVLLLAPAVLVQLVFGRGTLNSDISGSMILFWLIGYLAQFGVFMWIMNMVKSQQVLPTIVWWFVASLLPWAIDWTVPASSLLFLLWFPFVIGIACWIALAARRAKSLKEHGIRATGVVLEVLKPLMNVVINNVYIKRKVRVRIEREDGASPYEAAWNGLFMLGEIPLPGDRVSLLVDPGNPLRVEYDEASGAEKKNARAGTADPIESSATSHANLTSQLERLADLRDRGALTEAEFEAAKKKLLR